MPWTLLEVTNDSSEDYDTGAKLEAYCTIPTLREVVIVSHRARKITVHRRDAAGRWSQHSVATGGHVIVDSLGVELVVDTIYRNSSVP